MAVPQFLAGNFHYLKRTAVTDVQSIIDDLYVQLLLDDWTCTVGGTGVSPTTMRSPARSDYARFTIVLTRNSATRLYIQMYDHNGKEVSVTPGAAYSLNIGATPTVVYFFTGPTYMVLHSAFDPSFRLFCLLDTAPHPSLLAPIPFYVNRTSDYFESLSGYHGTLRSGEIDPATSSLCGLQRTTTDSAGNLITVSGAYMFVPVDIIDVVNNPIALLGRLPQAILVAQSINDGIELTVPIDVSTVATFTVINSGTSSKGNLAFRRA